MRTIDPAQLSYRERHQLVLSGIAPRPIALVATQDSAGRVNLAPYSFFNAFASHPPIVAIGPAHSLRTMEPKDTLRNLLETGECTISVVTARIAERVNLASAEYEYGVDEFTKAGLTKRPSHRVRPPGVAESPYIMECVLLEHIPLARDRGGNGNLVILEVVLFHVAESAFVDGRIDPNRLQLVGRLGYDWYCRAFGDALFQMPRPEGRGIGVDALPEPIRRSPILTGEDLALLASVERIPEPDPSFPNFPEGVRADDVELELAAGDPLRALYALLYAATDSGEAAWRWVQLQRIAKAFLQRRQTWEAWQTLLLHERARDQGP
ncbi:MAG: flavin reductase family protein [Candidatus Kapabacteria bacterium]|nr:flavin reductase family protein [Candidatus Kapabacteria bacterium]MDW8012840.1 flavin reductase family protein [Bacteroidota bacterium]